MISKAEEMQQLADQKNNISNYRHRFIIQMIQRAAEKGRYYTCVSVLHDLGTDSSLIIELLQKDGFSVSEEWEGFRTISWK